METVLKIAPDVAEAEFVRFAEAMDIDLTDKALTDEDRASLANQRAIIVRAISRGSLVINDAGEPVFTPTKGDATARQPLTFPEPGGSVMLSVDKFGKNAGVAKTYAMLGELTKTTPAHFSRMAERDLKVCRAIFALFFG
jgi:hypothetical protein